MQIFQAIFDQKIHQTGKIGSQPLIVTLCRAESDSSVQQMNKLHCLKLFSQEVRDARIEMQRRTNEWYEGLRAISSDDDDIAPGTSKMVSASIMETSLRERRDKQSPSSSGGSLDLDVTLTDFSQPV